MAIICKEELGELMQNSGKPAVSIYMPTMRAAESEQNPIRFRNLLRDAEAQLVKSGQRTPHALGLLEPAQKLLADADFWQHMGDGLALFVSPQMFRYYRVPLKFPEMTVVAERFQVKPLLPLFSEDGLFYVLAISQKEVKLLQCTHYGACDVTPAKMPSNLVEALNYDQPERSDYSHTNGSGGAAIFHGQGRGKEVDKDKLLKFFILVNRAVEDVVKSESAPLVVAAVDYLHGIYREANSYRHLLDKGVMGNSEGLNDTAIREKAWAIVLPYFRRSREEALARYTEGITKGLVTTNISHALLAAYDGRVSTLFVADGVQQWGQFDPDQRDVRLFKEKLLGAVDLLDLTAATTLAKNGTVYPVESGQVPGRTAIAALLRY